MSGEQDISLDEKRVYGARAGDSEVFVATGTGLVRVAVSDALVGEFGLAWRGDARDVSAGDHLVVATDEDVLGAVDGDDGREGREGRDGTALAFEPTGFGPATAVSAADAVVASDGERVARLTDDGWETLCELDGVRAVDGGLVAAESGVHRLDGTHLGLASVRDVAGSGMPLAATPEGLYYLGNGWMVGADGAFEVVAASADGTAHAATDDALYERGDGPGDWHAVDLPVGGRVADVAHAETTYAVTEGGVLLAADPAEGVWRDRTLGLPGARALAVVGGGGA